MPVVAKRRLLDLIYENHKSYYEMMIFFLDPEISAYEKEKKSRYFLEKEMDTINGEDISFPTEIQAIKPWLSQQYEMLCQDYQHYLARRKSGGPREYFRSIGEAFEFLIKVAPTKRVDGAWLYSLVHYWNDSAFHDLILTYMEELGLGDSQTNHVCIYEDLLRTLGLDDFDVLLEDAYYQQAAIQLALAYAPSEFIPEIVGYNLGHEQPVLHLLISNYELAELGIDSRYFNLHLTIDNVDSGHAYRAMKALEQLYLKYRDKEIFLNKVKRGYALNDKGMTSSKIIKTLDLEVLVHKILKRKALIGKLLHNEKCQFGGKTINQWLAEPADVIHFLDQLIDKKWIQLNRPPEESRFWRLIHHSEGQMYGVFSPVEQQIIYDWIAGQQYQPTRLQPSLLQSQESKTSECHFSYIADSELERLKERVEQAESLALKICKLTTYLAPDAHHKNIGLWSTRAYIQLLFPYLNFPNDQANTPAEIGHFCPKT